MKHSFLALTVDAIRNAGRWMIDRTLNEVGENRSARPRHRGEHVAVVDRSVARGAGVVADFAGGGARRVERMVRLHAAAASSKATGARTVTGGRAMGKNHSTVFTRWKP